jgi:hypothetical protein
MKINHNILVGGADVDKFVMARERVKNNLYLYKNIIDYSGILNIKLKVNGLEGGVLSLSIPELDEENKKLINLYNSEFKHNPDETKILRDWATLLVPIPKSITDPGRRKDYYGQKLGWLKYKPDGHNSKGYSITSKKQRAVIGINGEIIEKKKDTKKKDTKKKEKMEKKPKNKTKKNTPKKIKKKKKNQPKEGRELETYIIEQLEKYGEYIKTHDSLNYNAFLKTIEDKNRLGAKEEAERLNMTKQDPGTKDEDYILYPILEDTDNFNKRVYDKKEFKEGNEYPLRELPNDDGREEKFVELTNNICNNFEFELLPHQKFIKNFLSFQTPYNSLLLYHGLGTGKTCSSIGVAEEFRTYANQMGINKKIMIVCSEFVQANYKKQLFDGTKLEKMSDGLWNIKSCIGNKFLKEINPMNMENLNKEQVIKQIELIIRDNYEFIAYLSFANQIKNAIDKVSKTDRKERILELKKLYSDRLIIIDEVHNIRDVYDAPGKEEKSKKKTQMNKSTTEHLKTLVTYADNLKLLLLTGTPMYNEYKEIIWLLNLMNLNDNRYTIEESDIFDNKGQFTEDGKELLIQKSTGYVSFIKGEDPYMFPFRVYPEHDKVSDKDNKFATYKENSLNLLKNAGQTYPKYQLNGVEIENGIQHLDIFLTTIGSKQKEIYDKHINDLIKDNIVKDGQEKFSYGMLSAPSQLLNISYPSEDRDVKYHYGEKGLMEIMNFNKSSMREFEYKEKHEGFFGVENLKDYSGKITKIIKEIERSKGIILVYSQYIAGGCIPMALALEEAGYKKHGGSIFKKPPAKKDDKSRGSYIMITGQTGSKELVKTLNICNNKKNKDGDQIKVVIISRAGSEGLDFANIRQVHILDAWYNLNRTGQIEGRAIRNQSHCDLEIEKRNVLVFLHGTRDNEFKNEYIDLYMYRIAEEKAILSGKVARILKENAVDCLLNENQKQSNKDILNITKKITLSNGNQIEFAIGHHNNTQICDFMDCNYNCKAKAGEDWKANTYTYNDKFMKLTVTKIIEIIKRLFKERYVYDKTTLMRLIRDRRKYKNDEIYNALSVLINDKTEYIEDNLNRKGRLVNIDDLYLFQPLEVNYEQLSMYQRRNPIPYKPETIRVDLKDFEDGTGVGATGRNWSKKV